MGVRDKPVESSIHAEERMSERKVTRDQVFQAIAHGKIDKQPDGRLVFELMVTAGRQLKVIADDHGSEIEVVTCLWR